MELASCVRRAADRLGLELSDGDAVEVRRHGWSVTLDLTSLADAAFPSRRHHHAAWVLMGVRLALDKCAHVEESDPYTPMRHRRTSLRRYHEAASVHGEHLPLLVPRPTRQVFEKITDESAFFRPWLQADLEVLVIHETGKRLDVLTADKQQRSDLSEDKRFSKVRSALFYQSYKVRPRDTVEVDGGRLRIFETGEGFGASRALLLPEYDYDASREHGYLAVPTRDCIIIGRPDEQQSARRMLPALRDAVADAIDTSNFGLTDALFQLAPKDVELLEDPTMTFESTDAAPDELLLAVAPPE